MRASHAAMLFINSKYMILHACCACTLSCTLTAICLRVACLYSILCNIYIYIIVHPFPCLLLDGRGAEAQADELPPLPLPARQGHADTALDRHGAAHEALVAHPVPTEPCDVLPIFEATPSPRKELQEYKGIRRSSALLWPRGSASAPSSERLCACQPL